jgi:hypothetical protein
MRFSIREASPKAVGEAFDALANEDERSDEFAEWIVSVDRR